MRPLLVAQPREGLEDAFSHLAVVFGLVGRDIEVSFLLVAVERALNSVDIGDLEHIEEHLPRRQVAASPEPVGPVVEPRVVLADHHGEYLDEVGEVRGVVGVEEGAELPGVGVQVEHHFVPVLLDEFAQGVDDGLVVLVRVCPLPVGVAADELGPSVAVHHAVDVDHRHYLEHEVREQVLGFFAVGEQEVHHPLEHEAGSGLSRVLPRQDPD